MSVGGVIVVSWCVRPLLVFESVGTSSWSSCDRNYTDSSAERGSGTAKSSFTGFPEDTESSSVMIELACN